MSGRARTVLAVAVLVGASLTGMRVVSASPTPITTAGVTRLAGADRYGTAAAISAATWAPPVPVVYVATGLGFPDALSAGPVAARAGGPVLLVTPTAVPAAVAAELTRLRPQAIVVLGGPTVIGTAVQTQLGGFTTGPVTRVYGASRYATAGLVATGGFTAPAPVAYVATGTGYADALSGAAAAAHQGGPILLTTPTALPAETAAALTALHPKKIVIVGGPDAVSAGVATALAAFTSGPVTRIAGVTRYDTAATIAATVFGSAATVILANGETFPDALAAIPTASVHRAPLLLARAACVTDSTASAFAALAATRTIVVGGTSVVSSHAAAFEPCAPAPVLLRLPTSLLTAEPGYALVDGRTVLLPQKLVPVARLDVPSSLAPWTPLLQIRLDVTVPQRLAFSARAWCHPRSTTPQPSPGDDAFGLVLVTGSNPHPGTSGTAGASRRIEGRLPISVPAGAPLSCELQASPRTEGTTSSWLRIDTGSWTITARPVAGIGVAVGQVVIGRGPGAAGVSGRFASVAVRSDPGTVRRAYGDVMLSNCYAGYGACSVEGAGDAVVDATVVLVRRTSDGTACRVVRGSTVRIVVTTLQHHRHVSLPAATDAGAGSCGSTAGTFLEVTHVSGNSVEIESMAGNRPLGAQTLTWLERLG